MNNLIAINGLTLAGIAVGVAALALMVSSFHDIRFYSEPRKLSRLFSIGATALVVLFFPPEVLPYLILFSIWTGVCAVVGHLWATGVEVRGVKGEWHGRGSGEY